MRKISPTACLFSAIFFTHVSAVFSDDSPVPNRIKPLTIRITNNFKDPVHGSLTTRGKRGDPYSDLALLSYPTIQPFQTATYVVIPPVANYTYDVIAEVTSEVVDQEGIPGAQYCQDLLLYFSPERTVPGDEIRMFIGQYTGPGPIRGEITRPVCNLSTPPAREPIKRETGPRTLAR